MWSLAPQFDETVREVWRKRVYGDPMHRLMYRLKLLRQPLHQTQFPAIFRQLEEARASLSHAQIALGDDQWNEHLIQREREALHGYQFLSLAAHNYMVQKSKATWLQLGDDNTHYFHSLMRKKQYARHISVLKTDSGDL